MSDAMGIHLAEEANPDTDHDHVWAATFTTFFTKLVFALSFAVPLLLLPLGPAVIASIVWGMSVITVLSYSGAPGYRNSGCHPVPLHRRLGRGDVCLSYTPLQQEDRGDSE